VWHSGASSGMGLPVLKEESQREVSGCSGGNPHAAPTVGEPPLLQASAPPLERGGGGARPPTSTLASAGPPPPPSVATSSGGSASETKLDVRAQNDQLGAAASNQAHEEPVEQQACTSERSATAAKPSSQWPVLPSPPAPQTSPSTSERQMWLTVNDTTTGGASKPGGAELVASSSKGEHLDPRLAGGGEAGKQVRVAAEEVSSVTAPSETPSATLFSTSTGAKWYPMTPSALSSAALVPGAVAVAATSVGAAAGSSSLVCSAAAAARTAEATSSAEAMVTSFSSAPPDLP